MFLIGVILSSSLLDGNLSQLPQNSNITFISQGGDVDYSYTLAEIISRKKLNCYVKYAASASLQILLPSCENVYVSKNSVLQFHNSIKDIYDFSSDIFTGKYELNFVNFLYFTNLLEKTDIKMSETFSKKFKNNSCNDLKIENLNWDCNLLRIRKNVKYTGEEFMKLYSNVKEWK